MDGVSQSQMRAEAEGYYFYEQTLTYGDIEQRWLLVLYEKKRERELKQLDKAVARERERAHRALKQLGREDYSCEADAHLCDARAHQCYFQSTL